MRKRASQSKQASDCCSRSSVAKSHSQPIVRMWSRTACQSAPGREAARLRHSSAISLRPAHTSNSGAVTLIACRIVARSFHRRSSPAVLAIAMTINTTPGAKTPHQLRYILHRKRDRIAGHIPDPVLSGSHCAMQKRPASHAPWPSHVVSDPGLIPGARLSAPPVVLPSLLTSPLVAPRRQCWGKRLVAAPRSAIGGWQLGSGNAGIAGPLAG
jgi:hypothetical protein